MSAEADAFDVLAQAVDIDVDNPSVRALRDAVTEHIATREETTELSAVLYDQSVVLPGDVILIGGPPTLTNEQADTIRKHLMERMPGIGDVVVMGGCTLQGIFRKEGPS